MNHSESFIFIPALLSPCAVAKELRIDVSPGFRGAHSDLRELDRTGRGEICLSNLKSPPLSSAYKQPQEQQSKNF